MWGMEDICEGIKYTIAGIVAKIWLEWCLGIDGDPDPRTLEGDLMVAPDAATTCSRQRLTEVGQRYQSGALCIVHTVDPEQPPDTARPPEHDNQLGWRGPQAFAKAWHKSLRWAGATACARATDSLCVIPAPEFMGIGKRIRGIEENTWRRGMFAAKHWTRRDATRTPASVPQHEHRQKRQTSTSRFDQDIFHTLRDLHPFGSGKKRRSFHTASRPQSDDRYSRQERFSSRRAKPRVS